MGQVGFRASHCDRHCAWKAWAQAVATAGRAAVKCLLQMGHSGWESESDPDIDADAGDGARRGAAAGGAGAGGGGGSGHTTGESTPSRRRRVRAEPSPAGRTTSQSNAGNAHSCSNRSTDMEVSKQDGDPVTAWAHLPKLGFAGKARRC